MLPANPIPRTVPLLLLVLAGALPVIAACDSTTAGVLTGVPTTVIGGGGFNGAGNVGGQGGNDWPSGWIPAAGYGAHFESECTESGRCAVGGNTQQFGTLVEPDPAERVVIGDSLCFQCFGWISTQDIDREELIPVSTSGMESALFNALPEAARWELSFDYAFLAASASSEPAAAYIGVYLVPEGGAPRELMRVDRSFTQTTVSGSFTQLLPGGCGTTDRGTYRLGAVVDDTFPVCTGWREAALDLGEDWRAPFRIRMLAFEDVDGEPVGLAVDNMVLWKYEETP